jgi:hypothetical protein
LIHYPEEGGYEKHTDIASLNRHYNEEYGNTEFLMLGQTLFIYVAKQTFSEERGNTAHSWLKQTAPYISPMNLNLVSATQINHGNEKEKAAGYYEYIHVRRMSFIFQYVELISQASRGISMPQLFCVGQLQVKINSNRVLSEYRSKPKHDQ